MFRFSIVALALVAAAPAFAEDWENILSRSVRETYESSNRHIEQLSQMPNYEPMNEQNRTQQRILEEMQFESVKRGY